MRNALFGLALYLVSIPAHADNDATVEVGITGGAHLFSTSNELGVYDVPTADSQRNAGLFGARVGVIYRDHFGIEGELGFVPSESRHMAFDVFDLTYRAHAFLSLRPDAGAHQLVPFVVGGGGAMSVVSSDNRKVIAKDTDAGLYAGAGLKYRLERGFGVRADARILFPPGSSGDGPTVEGEFLLSIYHEWGRRQVAPPERPSAPRDSDGDGIPDDRDGCPLAAEDNDGFQDQDGCPDLDNDGDGVADTADKCPLAPEDQDGFQDADGCADADNDGDGIADAADHCPNEAEDKDGFQDADGCPDADNDSDGIADGSDTCPTLPETKNGYQDADGCPDELPAKWKKFTGGISGINFQVGSATLLPSSSKVLDQAVAVLKEFPDLRLEIQGHTDDQPIGKRAKFADNQELSAARAETVRQYFIKAGIDTARLTAKGYGETQPVEDPAGLKGGKLVAARAKNRRVEFRLITTSGELAPAKP